MQKAPSTRHSYRAVWRAGLLIAALHAAYAARYIARSSFVVEGQRYFCLFDDAMISMRYAANWADGHGLVWNPGERVEGYTNFGWTMIMGFVHLLRLSPAHSCLAVQLLGIPILWGCLFATGGLARACRLPPLAAIGAMLLTVTQWNLNFLTLSGMETGLLTLLVTLAMRDTVTGIQRRRGSARAMAWFTAALLVRPDTMLVALICGASLLIWGRRAPGRTLVGLVLVAAVVAAHALWRHAYYGEWLPNTYYLKATGWPLADRLRAGFTNAGWTAVALGLPFIMALAALLRFRRWQVPLLAAFLACVAYQTYLGGDAWPRHYRFVVPTTPGLMVAAAWGIAYLSSTWRGHLTARRVGVALTAACLLTANVVFWTYWIQEDPPLGTLANRTSVRYAAGVNKIADPEATVAVAWAGAFPYFSRRHCYDLLGKCDAHVSRLPARPEPNLAGHNKYDPAYTLSTYRPDLMVDGIRLVDSSFYGTYRAVAVEVDGAPLLLSVRRGSLRVRGGQPVSWEEGWRIFLETPRD